VSWQHLSTDRPKARKDYKCVWCGERIPVGERHVAVSGIMDGDFQSNRFHAECDTACQQEMKQSGEDCFMPHEYKRGSTEAR
jgi:hypothetical protein